MGNFMNAFEKFDNWRTGIQIFFIVLVVIALIATGTHFLSDLITGENNEIIEAKNFLTDTVELHENYQVTIISARTMNEIYVYENENDINSTRKEGNYIAIDLEIKKLENSDEKNHSLDINDFKLKNHTGVYVPLNTIMSLIDVSAPDIHLVDDGYIMSDVDFKTKKAVEDFEWVDLSLENNILHNITIYFYLPEGYKVEEEVMVLEVDFYLRGWGMYKGVDIMLANGEVEEENEIE